MQQLFVVATLVAVATAALHVSPDAVDFINGQSGLTWKASADQGSLISGASMQDIKNLCGALPTAEEDKPARRVFTDAELAAEVPTSFDSAAKWPQCPTITNIRDQSACGSCWAFGATEAMSDRYCTYGGPKNLEISAATLMECCSWCGGGCQGGQPSLAWKFWVSYGLFDNACQPYPFPKCKHGATATGPYPPCPKTAYATPACKPKTCTATGPNATATPYKGNASFSLYGEAQYQREIMLNGPIEVAFTVYADFPSYKGGVYQQTSNKRLGGHAVKAVGWGVLDNVPYWKIANSWNKGWGMDGYFLIKRGSDECGIETSGVAGSPAL
jgi:cysteine peptidase C